MSRTIKVARLLGMDLSRRHRRERPFVAYIVLSLITESSG